MTEKISIPYKGAELEVEYHYQPREEYPPVPEEMTVDGVVLNVGNSEIDLSDIISDDKIYQLMKNKCLE